jgi:gamma-glutamylcyclotransferase (GGCT)/AIG2-like uncharacterized protein YtfP
MTSSKVHVALSSAPPADHALAVYGSLAPGRVNHHHLADLRGTWRADLWVTGHLEDRGWGAGLGYPALVWAADGARVPVQLFVSEELPAHWARLDAFEGQDYERIVVPVHGAAGIVTMASLYAARTPGAPSTESPR